MIHLLTHNALAGELPDPRRVGINAIFKAKIRIEGETHRCFVKPLPDQLKIRDKLFPNHEHINEAIGYVLAKSCGFTVPDVAGVIVLPREAIPPHVLKKLDQDTPSLDKQEEFIAWFSQDMKHPDLIEYHAEGMDSHHFAERIYRRISAALAKHPYIAAVVSFDEWTLNSDRHPGNLIRASRRRLGLIDQGHIFTYKAWQAERLSRLPATCDNRVIDCVEATEPGWSERLPVKSERRLAYNGFTVSFRDTGEEATQEALQRLCMDQQDINHVTDFLASRLDPDHYLQAIGLVL